MTRSVSQRSPAAPGTFPARASFHLNDSAATAAAGARLAATTRGGLVVTLAGELGTGKTTLVRGLLRALGWTGPVKSPTYTLVEHYLFSSLYFYHFDLYRLNDPDEWEHAGFDEYPSERSVVVVEWPERAAGRLPPADLAITLSYAPAGPESGREITLEASTPAGRACLAAIVPPGVESTASS